MSWLSAAWIRFSDTGSEVPSTWANRLARNSSIIQPTAWTASREFGVAINSHQKALRCYPA